LLIEIFFGRIKLQTFSIGELKARFSEVIAQMRNGEEIVISYGKKKEKIAVLVPYDSYSGKPKRKLGLLKGRGRYVIHEDFKMSDEEMLIS
jgi:antitoxin (DNA-binding transcriptional repressor) of toxin-antitoxin stability system